MRRPQDGSTRFLRRALALVAALMAASLALLASPGAVSEVPLRGADPFLTVQAPWYTEQRIATDGQGDFPNYRIPALAVTNAGTVLAAYDGRPSAKDAPGPNSILERRSTDGGATWGPQTILRGGQTAVPVEGFSDPSILVDRQTGTIFNFHVRSYDAGFVNSQAGADPTARNVLHAEVSTSTDDGVTWTNRDITSDVTPDPATRSRFAASGQGIQLRYGAHAGRLLQQYAIIAGDGTIRSVSVYSDDHGDTWHSGQPVGVGMDENKTVELSDGTIMLNSRDSQRSGYRKVAFSQDGGVTYGPVAIEKQLPDPTNNASIIRAFPNAAEGTPEAKVLLFSNAASPALRANGTIRASCDDGKTWPVARVFQSGWTSYSTLAALPDGSVGLLYESAGGISFARFNLPWLAGMCGSIRTLADLHLGPGRSGTTSMTITNESGSVIDGATLTADAPQGWTVTFASKPGKLGPGTDWSTQVTVDVPTSAEGGTETIPVTFADIGGRTAHGAINVTVQAPGDETGGLAVTVAQVDVKSHYAVGDRVTFVYGVTSLTDVVTSVIPTGNLTDLDPANSAQNCRRTNLVGRDTFYCSSAYHVITQADFDAGSFLPRTTWSSTSDASSTTTELDGPVIRLP